MRNFLGVFFVLLIFSNGIAQETIKVDEQDTEQFFSDDKKSDTPTMPKERLKKLGILSIDYGLNFLVDAPADMAIKNWNSKSFNIYYTHGFRLGNSGIVISPGLGFGFDNFRFKNNVTLVKTFDEQTNNEDVALVDIQDILGTGISTKKSKVAIGYVEVPLEIGYHFNKTNYKRGMRIVLGGKVGYLFDTHTKIKYQERGETKKTKQKEDLFFSTIRYGAYLKFGYGRFNIYGYYGISPLFESGKGPEQTTTNTIQTGISFNIF